MLHVVYYSTKNKISMSISMSRDNFVDHVTKMFFHVALKLGGQKDIRFHSHALILVNFGLLK